MRGHDNAALNQGLVLSLPFAEGTGTVTRDVSKTHTPFTFGNHTAWTQLASGLWVLRFDGVDDYATGAGAPISVPGPCTWAAWVRWGAILNARGESYALSTGDQSAAAGTEGGLMINMVATRYVLVSIGFGSYNRPRSTTDSAIADTAGYYFHVGVYDRAQLRSYLNGIQQIDVTAYTTAIPATTKAAKLGTDSWDGVTWVPLNGDVALPRIWSRALAPAEVMSIFNAERSLFGV